MSSTFNTRTLDIGRERKAAWAFVLAAYLVVYGALLIATGGLPYAVDNNESFSSLWHARNMASIPLGETKGLADEVFAWHAAASPYVHTHQGNFPRLFAFLIYLLGARTIESQIVLTTLTVGLAGIWFAFRFLCRLGPPLFAALGCLVLITDYGLFGQWQFDTYRVWYGFFFFGSLLWVSGLEQRRGWPVTALGILNFAALFYGEYVFATFVAVTAAAYALFRYLRKPRCLLRAWLAVAAGGATAAAILTAQLTAYMGWSGVKKDVSFTLAARNMARDQTFTDMVDKFYRDHRIIFWHNFFDTADFRTLRAFGTSFFSKHLQYYSPWVSLSVIVLLSGVIAGLSRDAIGAPVSGNATVRPGKLALRLGGQVISGIAVAVVACLCVRYLRPLFDDSSQVLWSAAMGLPPPGWLGWLGFVVSTMLALTFAVVGTGNLVGGGNRLTGLFKLTVCVMVGYALTYRIFTGYIYSGYLNRQAPFLVFATDILLAGALYMVLEMTRRRLASALSDGTPAILAIAGSALMLFFIGTWTTMQLAYLIVVPPTGEPFLKLLSHAPFHGHSFVMNDYPASVAEKTRAWAYDDPTITSGQVKLTPDGFVVEHNTQYLWFADAEQNKSYLKPEFGLLVDQPSSISQALNEFIARSSKPEHAIAFDTTGLIKRSQEPLQPFLRYQLAATDGHSFSIIKFDWDFPPYLRPVDAVMREAAKSMSFQQKISLSESNQEQSRRWRVELEPVESSVSGGRANAPVLLTEASVDGRPIFTEHDLVAAGWKPGGLSSATHQHSWIGTPGKSVGLSAMVVGDNVSIRLREGPTRGSALVGVNDMTQLVDLGKPLVADHVIALNTAAAHDRYTYIPSLSPGVFVNTFLTAGTSGPDAVVEYRYAQQDLDPEEGTTVRVYNEPSPGTWVLAETVSFLGRDSIPVSPEDFRRGNPDTLHEYSRMRAAGETRTYMQWLTDHLTANPGDRRREGIIASDPIPGAPTGASRFRIIPLSPSLKGRIQLSVTPSTRTKTGPEYFGITFTASRLADAKAGRMFPVPPETTPSRVQRDLPYGYIKLRLRFPVTMVGQGEPIVSAGVEEAADFIYVRYIDPTHIRIGFDHWFSGGPLSPPIPIDYSKEHDLEISMGSLFPPEEDVVFAGMSAGAVSRLKGNVRVTLDGETIIDSPSAFWDSPPTQVAIGKNDVKGTTSSTRFTGDIIECKRIWPDLQ
jgi:hypothetical protein